MLFTVQIRPNNPSFSAINFRRNRSSYLANPGKFLLLRIVLAQFPDCGKVTWSVFVERMRVARDTNDPNNCLIYPNADRPRCPRVGMRDLEGHLGLRAFTSLSMVPGNNVVPFYFQPTLGGADLNGNPSLSSYQDFRFRAPNIILFQENFEHSIYKLPVGFTLRADQGRVALTRGDLGSNHWIHSYATGLTLRAGGFPEVYILFAFGGSEGTHTLVNVNTSLLRSAVRPSLF
jgi:hypothetical protein